MRQPVQWALLGGTQPAWWYNLSSMNRAGCNLFSGAIDSDASISGVQQELQIAPDDVINIPLIHRKTQVEVGLYGIHSFFLQFVGPEFIHQTDASALLVHI